MSFKVLITTSGIGSRLGDLTDFTNKCLVRISDKPAISHIIEKYPKNTKFVITLGHFGNQVKDFLEIAYPKYNFEFVEVDKYTGTGTSLAYSILQAKDYLQCPFIFNACDTILDDKPFALEKIKENFCLGSKVEDSSQYSTLLIDKGRVLSIKNKGEKDYDAAYIGICGIKDYKLFWDKLERAYSLQSSDTSLFDGTAINEMIPEVKFKYIQTDKWFDMGNIGELEKTRKYFKTSSEVLEKKEESIYFYDEHVIKFFYNKNVSENRTLRAEKLRGLVPNIVDSKNNFYKYKKVDGKLLADSVNEKSFRKLLNWAEKNLWIKKEHEDFSNLCYKFYFEKTKKRIEDYKYKYGDSVQIINGIEVPLAIDLVSKINTDWLCDGISSQFHGDFILDNILETENGFCLLDWRQDFGGSLEVGDVYYDISKLNHNLTVNHKIVNRGLYDSNESNCHILCNSKLVACKQILKNFIEEKNLDFKKVEVLTSLIWINMAPLHDYPFSKFLFNFGKYNLYRSLNV